jgi:site-specific DNA-methyltransferase (adenine-specific)
MLLKGNCLETLKTLETASVDSIVTDPPYELGFMGQSWDNSGIAYSKDLWAECLRVLKPGGHLLAFSGSRTYHRMVVAIEDSGFEVRDQIMWLYGSGFPKSLDVSKAIDKAAGAEREVIKTGFAYGISVGQEAQGYRPADYVSKQLSDVAITNEAKQWEGWGTALKPAHEPICVARKPLIGTVANNVLTYGTGALNIDGSRVGSGTGKTKTVQYPDIRGNNFNNANGTVEYTVTDQGRWPANVIHDGSDEVLAGFPNEAGRFFYCAKASKSERDAGLDIEQFPLRNYTEGNKMGGSADTMLTSSGNPRDCRKQNFHPTVKPLALMRYLIKLVTPTNGTVLDPFLGSGTTAVAATLEGFNWIGCEMTEDYWPIIEARIEWAQGETGKTLF